MIKKEKSFAVVTTTIRIPELLRRYAQDARDFKRKIEQFVIAGDRKTPDGVRDFCARLSEEFQIPFVYLSAQDQDNYLKTRPRLKEFLPWNCIQRRNAAVLYAYDKGEADIIVTLDDDNFISHSDYFGCHAHIGDEDEVEAVSSSAGWWNICEMLEESKGRYFYHRGYPLSKRWPRDEKIKVQKIRACAVVNAGLWLDDPDVDALTRLSFPVRASRRSSLFRNRVACAPGTWSPFNSQNTALAREVIPAYFLFPYIGRYDDIWASYVVRAIADYLGDVVTYGTPVVRQKRNPHDYFKDFDDERFGLTHNDVFLKALTACRFQGKTYRDCFAEIAEQFPARIHEACRSLKKDAAIFEKVVEAMKIWKETFR